MAKLQDSVGIQINANLNLAQVEAQLNKLGSKDYKLNIGANAKNLDKSNKGVKDLSKNIDNAKTSTGGFIYEMKTAIIRTIEWTVAVGGLYKALHLFTDGVEYINELNKSLTEISVVTGQTREQVELLSGDFNDMAREMAQSTKDLADASVIFYRQGKSQVEVMDLLRATTMASSISNVEMAQTAEYLTSALNGMKIPAEKALDVVDKFAAVGATTATSLEEISEAMSQTASSANLAGVSLDNLAAFIGTVSAVTRQSASRIGVSFKTIFARMTKLTSGMEDEGDTINDVEKALDSVGIKLRDSANSFRDLDDVLIELGTKWKDLDETEQAYLGTVLAGVRQKERLIALLDNMDEALRLQEVSLNSAGTAQQQYNRWLQGNEAAQKKLTAELEKFWQQLINSKTVKSFYEFGTFSVKILELISKKVGILNIAITALIVTFVKLKSVFLARIFEQITFGLIAGETAFNAYTIAMNMAALAANGLSTILGTAGLIGVIYLAVKAITTLIGKWAEYKRQQEALISGQEKLNDLLAEGSEKQLKDTIENIKSLNFEYNKLLEKINKETKERFIDPVNFDPDKLEAYKNRLKEVKEEMIALGVEPNKIDEAIRNINYSLYDADRYAQDFVETVNELTDGFNQQTLKIDDMIAEIDLLKDSKSDLIENGYLEQDVIDALNDKYGDFIETTQYSNDAMIDFLNTKTKVTETDLENQIKYTESIIKLIETRVSAYNQELVAMAGTAEGQRAEQMLDRIAKRVGTYNFDYKLQELKEQLNIRKTSLDYLRKEDKETENSTKSKKDEIQAIEYLEAAINREIDLLEDAKEASKRKYEAEISQKQKELDALTAKNKLLEQEEERKRKLEEIEKRRAILANVEAERNVRLLSTSGQWEWVADPQALSEAKENLSEAEDELKQYDIDLARQAQEEKIQLQLDNLKEELDINQQGYDDKISILKDYLDKEKDMITLTNDLMLESYTALYEKIQSLYPDLSLGGATISGGESDTTPKLDLGKKYEYLGSLIGGSDVEKSDWAKQEAIKYRGYLPTAMGAQLEGTNVSIMNLTVENVEDWDDFIEQATNIANTQ